MKLKSILYFAAVIIAAAWFSLADGPQDDIRNGWYPQLPPISSADLNATVQCLILNGAPSDPEVYTERIANLAGGPAVAPTQLIWRRGGSEIRTDAVLTYHSPAIAYLDLARTFGLPQKWITCATPEKVLVSIANPVGAAWPDRCPTCARSASGDVFDIGAVLTDSRGTWIKRRAWNLFVPFGYWERQ